MNNLKCKLLKALMGVSLGAWAHLRSRLSSTSGIWT